MKQFVSKVNKCNLFNIISSNSTFTSTSSNRREDYSQEEFLVCRLVFLMDSQSSGEYLLNTFHSWNKLNFQLEWIWCFSGPENNNVYFNGCLIRFIVHIVSLSIFLYHIIHSKKLIEVELVKFIKKCHPLSTLKINWRIITSQWSKVTNFTIKIFCFSISSFQQELNSIF